MLCIPFRKLVDKKFDTKQERFMSKTRAFLVLGTILIVYIILFPFTKSHEHIPQKCIHSMSNLRRIAIFLLMYAQENDNLLPENIEQVEEYNKMSDVFKSPLKPIDFNGPSYIYVSGHTLIKGEKLNPKYIFVYENPEYRA